MRVLIISEDCHGLSAAGNANGQAVANRWLCQSLVDLGHDVTFFVAGALTPLPIPPPVPPAHWLSTSRTVPQPSEIRQCSPDLLIYSGRPCLLRPLEFELQAQWPCPVVWWCHSDASSARETMRQLATRTQVWCAGPQVAAELADLGAVALPPGSVTPVPVPPPPLGDKIVVPSISEAKGGSIALAVAQEIRDVPWLVITARATEAEIAPWRKLAHITVSDPVPEEELFRAARVMLSPSRKEANPLALAGAAARGIPVVASDLLGCRAAAGTTGIYLPLDAPTARWAEAIRKALVNPRPAPVATAGQAHLVAALRATVGDKPATVTSPVPKPAPASPPTSEPSRGVAPPAPIPPTPKPEAKAELVPATAAPRHRPGRPWVLLVSDVPRWAFDQNMRDLAEYLCRDFHFDFSYVDDWHRRNWQPPFTRYDAIFLVHHLWINLPGLPLDRIVSSLRSRWFDVNRRQPPGTEEFDLVNKIRAFQVCTADNFAELEPHCSNARYLTNPVNMRRFPKATAQTEVVVCWSGNFCHQVAGVADVKGYVSIIEPACKAAGVPTVIAEYNRSRRPPDEMPAFYQEASVCCVGSLYEGASNSLMEAMASGLAVVCTDTGNHREMHEAQIADYGDSGIILADRSTGAFIEALAALKREPKRVKKMGQLNRRAIKDRWSWSVWANQYADFLRMALP